MTSVQVPLAFRPAKAVASDCCGLNVAKNGAPPLWIGVAALSSKTVLVKLAVFDAVAHAAEQRDRASAGCRPHVVMVQGRRQVGVVGIGEVELDPQAADPGRWSCLPGSGSCRAR